MDLNIDSKLGLFPPSGCGLGKGSQGQSHLINTKLIYN